MPELPEVETTRKGIQPKVEGQTIKHLIVRNPALRWPVPEELTETLPGKVIRRVKRRAKYLLLETDQGTLILHLGMSGNLRVLPHDTPVKKHDHIDLVMENGFLLRYHDPRRFGAFLWTESPIENHPLFEHLGPEPLTDDFSVEGFFQQTRNKSVSIKSFIMNNKNVVGVGNIYANEALFMSGISPTKPAGTLTRDQTDRLVQNIKSVLKTAINQGGTTLKDFLTPDGQPGYFEQQLNVYGKAGTPCPTCRTHIVKIVQNQRASYYCPNCQC
ncbi:MAG: bifunctional DNA-formamidopyrimidine glycosylase/DNA-(apurinic or apyrimidinic site) lyase [Hydrogenovibrio sp.]|nr:bifunctional DNA-formamidopyrimidine glycosylase/DNA-(apurinic or apyrimidinic site) lyase [Hydrogenovibrio sp.]